MNDFLTLVLTQGHPPPEIYHRWVAFGLFSTHSRLHGSASYRVPWVYGEDASKTLAKFVETKHRLMPYLYNYVRAKFSMILSSVLIHTFLGYRSTYKRSPAYACYVPRVH